MHQHPKEGRTDPSCSFCGKGRRETGPLVEGPGPEGNGGVYICRECVRLALAIFDQTQQPSPGDTLHDNG